MTSTLFILQIVLSVIITILVLLQKSASMGLGAYSSSNESLFGAKGPAGFLTKASFAVALLFVANTLALGYAYSKERNSSVLDRVKTTANKVVPAPTSDKNKSVVPSAPTSTVEKKAPTVPSAPATNTK